MIKYLSRLYLVRKNNFSEEFEALLSKKKGRKQKRKNYCGYKAGKREDKF